MKKSPAWDCNIVFGDGEFWIEEYSVPAPLVFAVTPRDYIGQWPSAFIETGLRRLLELGRVDAEWVDSVRLEFQEAEADPTTVMTTPMVLEIIAERW